MSQEDYIKQLEETNEALKRKLERSEMRNEELMNENKKLSNEAPHIVQRRLGVELVAGNLVMGRSVGSADVDNGDGVINISYDLEVFGETKFGYITEDLNNHIAEFDKMLKTGVVPKHASSRVYSK